MADKSTDPGLLFYFAKAVFPYIGSLKRSAQNILKRKNIEDIHDIRVSSRRIRSCLAIFNDYLPPKKNKSWQNEIKKITSAYGSVRDLDVQIDLISHIIQTNQDVQIRRGLRRIKLRLSQKREKRQKSTQQITQSILDNTVLLEMEAWSESLLNNSFLENYKTPELFRHGYRSIQSRLDEFLFYEVFIFDAARIEELHQMRIAAKRLRYALEIFSDLYDAKTDFVLDITRQVQQYLGEIHDADVWISFLPQFMEREIKQIEKFYGYRSPFSRLRPGIEFLIANRKEERTRLYLHFLDDWKDWKMKETWLNLRKILFLTNIEDFQPKSSENDISDQTEKSDNNP